MAENWSGLVRVQLRSVTAGLIVTDGRITDAAPILGWAIGQPMALLATELRARGYLVQAVDDV